MICIKPGCHVQCNMTRKFYLGDLYAIGNIFVLKYTYSDYHAARDTINLRVGNNTDWWGKPYGVMFIEKDFVIDYSYSGRPITI